MKCVILAGGFGTRISEFTGHKPKPMIEIGGLPLILHIMRWYSKFGFREFIISCGYKSEYIKDYFSNYLLKTSDFTVDFQSNHVEIIKKSNDDFKITFVDTGINTFTGGRIKGVENYINNERFFATYGDGLCDININKLLEFHLNHKRIGTVTAVRPRARFGELVIKDESVNSFKEKPHVHGGWINGGYFVFEPDIFNYISDLQAVLEEEPLERLSEDNQLNAFKHTGFWQCMDSKRDYDLLTKLYNEGNAPWL